MIGFTSGFIRDLYRAFYLQGYSQRAVRGVPFPYIVLLGSIGGGITNRFVQGGGSLVRMDFYFISGLNAIFSIDARGVSYKSIQGPVFHHGFLDLDAFTYPQYARRGGSRDVPSVFLFST